MASKSSKRRRRRARRLRQGDPALTVDMHTQIFVDTVSGMSTIFEQLAQEDSPSSACENRISDIIEEVVKRFATVEPTRIIEIVRMACLPWPWNSGTDSEGGPARAEVAGLLAVASSNFPPGSSAEKFCYKETGTDGHDADGIPGERGIQPITTMVSEELPQVDELIKLCSARNMYHIDDSDRLGYLARATRSAQVWIRNTSYPEMEKHTVKQLFSDTAITDAILRDLGFTVADAFTVLNACHDSQVNRFNDRMSAMARGLCEAMNSDQAGDPEAVGRASSLWTRSWDADVESVTLSIDDLVADTGVDQDRITAVVDFFTLDIEMWDPQTAVEEFFRGNNPLRTHPVVRTSTGRCMLVHDSHVAGAVRENIEQHLKSTSQWERYQNLRGKYLEERTQSSIWSAIPEAQSWHGFNYYIPIDESEDANGPSRYTKRVEADHLFVQDDVAIIVEDKAVAISPRSRAGETRKLRIDLTKIIANASDQAGRLQDRIERDSGIYIHGIGWIDLSCVREVHTIAVSLEDLSGVATTTAGLVKAGLLTADRTPWTVSLHDLDLITCLLNHPAEFLLYLRRRCDIATTEVYFAPDELDLFLYFLEAGLYVEPDPDEIREAFPYMPPATNSERRRFQQQGRVYISSRTDPLDEWYRSLVDRLRSSEIGPNDLALSERQGEDGNNDGDVTYKPTMKEVPIREFLNMLRGRAVYGWLSICATLLSGDFVTQRRIAKIPENLLSSPRRDGQGRSLAVPIISYREDSWLLVWMTRPLSEDINICLSRACDYLTAKKNQLSIVRGVGFLYDEHSGRLIDVLYDGHSGPLDKRLQTVQDGLRAVDSFDDFFGSGQRGSAVKARPGGKKKGKR